MPVRESRIRKGATKTGQHLGAGGLELGRDLDDAPGGSLQTAYLLAELALIGHGACQVERAARPTDQQLPLSLHLKMAVCLHVHLLP